MVKFFLIIWSKIRADRERINADKRVAYRNRDRGNNWEGLANPDRPEPICSM
jgi:hypothetical protein